MPLPAYYSSLRPFRQTFRTGVPVLTYHHVGPRHRGARLKGLYLSPRLFSRQIAQLQSAGYSTAEFLTIRALSCSSSGDGHSALPAAAQSLGSAHKSSTPLPSSLVRPEPVPGGQSFSNPQQRVFLTFDDGFRDVFEYALPLFQQTHFRGIVFLLSNLLGKSNEWQQKVGDILEPLMDAAQVRSWLAAGQEIGSHTQTHPRLTLLSLPAAREEITASKKSLEDRFGIPIDHFCYPYGDWNDAVRDLVIAAGYKTACTTHAGVNTPETSPFELRRFTARYSSRSLKALWQRFRPFSSCLCL